MFGLKHKLTPLKRKDVPQDALLRQKMRLEAHMAMYPLRGIESRSIGFSFAMKPFMASLIVFTVLGGTGGVVFAAQESLPGEALYPVKIASEEVRARLALSQDAQFKYRSRLAERRLSEAEELFLHDDSAPNVRDRRIAIAMDRYEEHVERLGGIVEKFESQETPKDHSHAIEAIEKVLGTHARLLESATATDDGSDISVAAFAKGAIELDKRLTDRFQKLRAAQTEKEDEKRVRFRNDINRLKMNLKKAEVFREKPDMRENEGFSPNRNLWPKSWEEEVDDDEEERAESDSEIRIESEIELHSELQEDLF